MNHPSSSAPSAPALRWREAGVLYRATTEEALVAEMRARSHDDTADEAAYMATVARRAAMYLDGRVIRTTDPVTFVADCVQAALLEAVWVYGLGTDAMRCVPIPGAQYLTIRVATLPRLAADAADAPNE